VASRADCRKEVNTSGRHDGAEGRAGFLFLGSLATTGRGDQKGAVGLGGYGQEVRESGWIGFKVGGIWWLVWLVVVGRLM
jgi:hypothetical protein